MILHFSISKAEAPQGVSTVVDMLKISLPSAQHQFFRPEDKLYKNKVNGTPISSRNIMAKIKSDLFYYMQNVKIVYISFMLFSAFKIIFFSRRNIAHGNLCLAHDVFCLFWLAVFRKIRIIDDCHLSLYNHSDGVPFNTLRKAYNSNFVKIIFLVMEFVVRRVSMYRVYSLSESASQKIKLFFRNTSNTKFIVTVNYVTSIELTKDELSFKKNSIWMIGTVCERKGQIEFFKKLKSILENSNHNISIKFRTLDIY